MKLVIKTVGSVAVGAVAALAAVLVSEEANQELPFRYEKRLAIG